MKGELDRGEHKSLQTDRVILMPGPRLDAATSARCCPNEKYIGNNVYNWRSFKLKKKGLVNEPGDVGSRRKARSRASCRPTLFYTAQGHPARKGHKPPSATRN